MATVRFSTAQQALLTEMGIMWVTYFNGDIYVKSIIIQFQENGRKTNSSKETARAKNAAEMSL